ncbi:MAG: gamma-glutamylcyclotransferase family protein [Nitrospiraceae bacterium]
MLYFAYGSNLDRTQMRERCPSARFVCTARLPQHRLAFTRRSTKWHGGVADVVADSEKNVWGVVYHIDELDVASLDRCEGYQPGRSREENIYVREEQHVFKGGDENKPLAVFLYMVVDKAGPFPCHTNYKHLIVEGARYWHLPQRYLESLERIETPS